MGRMRVVIGVVLAAVIAAGSVRADAPPVAPVRPVVEEHFGTKVVDPYRYMENFHDPAVQAWVKGQAEYAAKTLAVIPGRQKLLERAHVPALRPRALPWPG